MKPSDAAAASRVKRCMVHDPVRAAPPLTQLALARDDAGGAQGSRICHDCVAGQPVVARRATCNFRGCTASAARTPQRGGLVPGLRSDCDSPAAVCELAESTTNTRAKRSTESKMTPPSPPARLCGR